MTSADYLAIGLSTGGALFALLVAYLELRLRKVFATKEETEKDLNGFGSRVTDLKNHVAALEQLAEGNEKRVSLIEQQMSNDHDRWKEQVGDPIKKMSTKIDQIVASLTDIQLAHGGQLGEHGRDLKALGRTTDDLKQRVGTLEAR